MKYFKPDYEIQHFSELTKEWLNERNIKAIFSDLDSTLAIHDHEHGSEELGHWIEMLKENNVTLFIVSNNSQGRVDRFVAPYGIHGLGMSGKPGITRIEKEMNKLGEKSETSLFLGDQIFTDVWCGKRLNMTTVLVHPIGREHEPWNITLKRKLETLIKKRWK
ncbi:YqeG family HAD IIIA-type phosphatase [Bacillus sp. FJAT-45350]|uniref:YqeG family HAD IIIA-type phosphatase n=1 Tax=Bacillus sp. FJAT-45350 TaxID=2011014 RepID=UPI000BB6BB64|nr:YqeG family HAD IIIA-type phosphatase [Bacillus sp. FJAT-45350]